MDSWLWDPPIYDEECNFSLGEDHWQPDFRFWHEPDLIENDAANIKACIHVLRILIKNADTEISELEEDIILLQSQLALTDETWSQSFSNVLIEKIKSLEKSLWRLKNENVQLQEMDDQLQVHPEPAEKIHDILKRLLEKHSPRNDEQNKSSSVGSNRTYMDKSKLIYSVAEVHGAQTSTQTTTPSCVNGRRGEDRQQTIADLGDARRTMSGNPTLAKQHKLADMITDSVPDAVEQEQLSSTSTMKPQLGTRYPLEWEREKNDESPYEWECSSSESIWDMLEQMQNTEVTVPEASEPNLLLRHEQNPVSSQSEPQAAQIPGLAAENGQKLSPATDRHASDNTKSGKKTYLDHTRSRSLHAAPDPSIPLGSQPGKRWKNSSIPTLIKEYKESRNIQTTSEGQKDTAQSVIQQDHPTRNRHKENGVILSKSLKSISGSTSMDCTPEQILESLPKEKLRSFAKEKSLKGYYKLRKSELVKLLMEKVKDEDLHETYPYLFI